MSARDDNALEELLWIINNSDSVIGLQSNGEAMPWAEVLRLYAPSVTP